MQLGHQKVFLEISLLNRSFLPQLLLIMVELNVMPMFSLFDVQFALFFIKKFNKFTHFKNSI